MPAFSSLSEDFSDLESSVGTGAVRRMVAMARTTSRRAARPKEEGAAHLDCREKLYIAEMLVPTQRGRRRTNVVCMS